MVKREHYTYRVDLTAMEQEELTRYPGLWLRVQRRGVAQVEDTRLDSCTLQVPHNLEPVIRELLRDVTHELRPPMSLLPPMLDDEAFAGQFQPGMLESLLPYQREGIEFSADRVGTCFWHPTGSGKTRTAIVSSLLYPGPVIEVTKGGVRAQHVREWRAVTRLHPFACKPLSEVRKRDRWRSLEEYLDWCRQEHQRPVLIVGWEGLPAFLPAFQVLLRRQPGTVIWDESHKAKSHDRWDRIEEEHARTNEQGEQELEIRARYVARENLTASAMLLSRSARRRLGTTATPVANTLSDIWAQLDLVEPTCWGGFWDFAKRYCGARKGNYGWIADDPVGRAPEVEEELAQRLSWTVHQVDKATVHKHFPEKTRRVIRIPPEEQDTPEAVATMLKRAAKGATTLEGQAHLLDAQLMEASARCRSFVLNTLPDWLAIGKGKVLIFTGRNRDVEDWAERITSRAPRLAKAVGAPEVHVWWSHGSSHTPDQREDLRQAYMDHPGPCVGVLSTEAWGESFNLQDTDVQVVTMLPWTPKGIDQLEGRGHRLGGRQILVIYLVPEGSKAEAVAGVLATKFSDVVLVTGDEESAAVRQQLIGDEDELIAEHLRQILAYSSDDEDDT